MQNEEQRGERYARLSQLDDYRVSDEDPDPRGWSVVDRDGAAVGTVEDLIVDTDAMKVRYLEIVVADSAAGRGGRARIPANRVDLDPDQRRVVTDLTRAELPAFLGAAAAAADTHDRHGSVVSSETAGSETAATAETSFRGTGAASGVPETQRLTRAEEEVRVGTRPVQAGEVVVGKHVETERVTMPVQRRVEHVRVERRAVNDATGQAELREGEIRVPVMEEEVVVEKRPVVKEEIVVTREGTTETEQVAADVRRERVDVSGDEALVEDGTATSRQRAGGGNRG
jgi:uncharacterized protein (TIGR02271 family)